MGAQIVLTSVFAFKVLGTGPWSEMPSFTAHQVIATAVLLYLSVEGLRLQWQQNALNDNNVDRLTDPRHIHLSEFVLGMMVFWDIPTGLCTRALREVPMVFHHFAMAATAALALGALSNGNPIVGYYAPFFFGVIEWSSLPLIIVDIFHPKHKAWHSYLTSPDRSPWFNRINATARLVFAASFLLLRTVCFPYVSIAGVLTDVWHVTSLPLDQRRNVPNLPLVAIATSNTLFSCLQIYWGNLLIQQILKLVGLVKGKSPRSKPKNQ